MSSVVRDFTYKNKNTGRTMKFHTEQLSSFEELSEVCHSRTRTDRQFTDMTRKAFDLFEGCRNYEEAFKLLREGCPDKVAPLKTAIKANVEGQRKRYKTVQTVCGSSPIVPLALMGIPDSMLAVQQVPIKTKVINLYYDTSVLADKSSAEVLAAGARMIGAMQELEAQGYRFGLTVLKAFAERSGSTCDALLVKIKDANRPLDLRRISFPLLHTAFPRVIGYDWYSKFAGAEYRYGYGQTISNCLNRDELTEAFSQAFGTGSIFLSAGLIIDSDIEAIKDALVGKKVR